MNDNTAWVAMLRTCYSNGSATFMSLASAWVCFLSVSIKVPAIFAKSLPVDVRLDAAPVWAGGLGGIGVSVNVTVMARPGSLIVDFFPDASDDTLNSLT